MPLCSDPTIPTSLCVSLPSRNSPQPLPSLSRQFQVLGDSSVLWLGVCEEENRYSFAAYSDYFAGLVMALIGSLFSIIVSIIMRALCFLKIKGNKATGTQLVVDLEKYLPQKQRQPPLLSAMVHAIYSRTGDMQLVRKSLPALLKEYHFWNSGSSCMLLEKNKVEMHIEDP
nr:trehalase [Quercus suber]